MFTIAFNTVEKQKLLEILNKDNSIEAKEFVNRINSCGGFYTNEDDKTFRYFGCIKTPKYVSVPGSTPDSPSGVKYY